MSRGIARIVGDGHGEAVTAVEVRIRRIAPQAGRRIDARRPARRRSRHGEHRAVSKPVHIRCRQGIGDRRILVARPARAPRHHRGIVHGSDHHGHGRGFGHAPARDGVGKAVGPIEVRIRGVGHGAVG